MERLNPFYLYRGHWKTLSDYRKLKPRAAWVLRVFLLVVPVAVGLWFGACNGELKSPDAILAGLALLAGALLAAFAQLASWRLRLTQRQKQLPNVERVDRDALDETSAQLLVAAYESALATVALVVAMNVEASSSGAISGWWAAGAVALSIHVVLIFLVAIPRLYSAYVSINGVREELSGFHTEMPGAKNTSSGSRTTSP